MIDALTEFGLLAARDARRATHSGRGLFLLFLTVVGTATVTAVFNQLGAHASSPPGLIEKAAEWLFGGREVAQVVATAPPLLIVLFILTVWLSPLLVAIIGFDCIAGDLHARSIRYTALRVRRETYLLAKFAGLVATVACLSLVAYTYATVSLARHSPTFGAPVIAWGVRLWVTSTLIATVWCAFATLLSSLSRSLTTCLLMTLASFASLWGLRIIGRMYDIAPLQYFYPNTFDSLLLHPSLGTNLLGVGACLLQSAAYLTVGAQRFSKRDL